VDYGDSQKSQHRREHESGLLHRRTSPLGTWRVPPSKMTLATAKVIYLILLGVMADITAQSWCSTLHYAMASRSSGSALHMLTGRAGGKMRTARLLHTIGSRCLLLAGTRCFKPRKSGEL